MSIGFQKIFLIFYKGKRLTIFCHFDIIKFELCSRIMAIHGRQTKKIL